MIEPGRGVAYLALFSEIGFVLLVTTLGGTLLGHWIDRQLQTNPVFALGGFFLGVTIGTIGIYRLVSRFLAKLD
jgi:F0F1-type ATP synthase assembly protein I